MTSSPSICLYAYSSTKRGNEPNRWFVQQLHMYLVEVHDEGQAVARGRIHVGVFAQHDIFAFQNALEIFMNEEQGLLCSLREQQPHDVPQIDREAALVNEGLPVSIVGRATAAAALTDHNIYISNRHVLNSVLLCQRRAAIFRFAKTGSACRACPGAR